MSEERFHFGKALIIKVINSFNTSDEYRRKEESHESREIRPGKGWTLSCLSLAEF